MMLTGEIKILRGKKPVPVTNLSTINPIWAGLDRTPASALRVRLFFVIKGREYLERLS
jgi:hypothetical protein